VEIGELVNVEIPAIGPDDKCPFSHDKPKADEKNELGGIGTKLGQNMSEGIGIGHESRASSSFVKGSKELDPRKRPGKQKLISIFVEVSGQKVTLSEGGRPLPYPLTCAAHHLIPAQESLKAHDILNYMCKKGEQQDFRNSKAAAPAAVGGSKVWGNVAYNVNGCQNGVWLPGNYAVGGGTGGTAVWQAKANAKRSNQANANWVKALDTTVADWERGDDDDEEEAKDAFDRALNHASKARYMLAGANQKIDDGNPKWGYVKAAMDAARAQFHDRHEDYSKQVRKYLTKIAAAYKDMHTAAQKSCKECEKAERPDGAGPDLVGPPYPIVGRLKAGSDFFKQYLQQTGRKLGKRTGRKIVTAKNIYTSGWVNAWFNS